MKPYSEQNRLTETRDPRDLELGAAIRAVRAERASSREIRALAERLAPQLGAPAATLATASWSSASSKWLVSIVLAFGLGSISMWHLGRGEWPAVAPIAAREVTPSPIGPGVPTRLPAAIAVAPEVVVPPLHPQSARTKRRLKSAKGPQPRAAEPPSNAEAELELLGRAQRALDLEPRAALALAQEHAAIYPRGLFLQEREMLAIQALLKLQQRRAALARAKDFLDSYPTSPHARHLRPLFETGE